MDTISRCLSMLILCAGFGAEKCFIKISPGYNINTTVIL